MCRNPKSLRRDNSKASSLENTEGRRREADGGKTKELSFHFFPLTPCAFRPFIFLSRFSHRMGRTRRRHRDGRFRHSLPPLHFGRANPNIFSILKKRDKADHRRPVHRHEGVGKLDYSPKNAKETMGFPRRDRGPLLSTPKGGGGRALHCAPLPFLRRRATLFPDRPSHVTFLPIRPSHTRRLEARRRQNKIRALERGSRTAATSA